MNAVSDNIGMTHGFQYMSTTCTYMYVGYGVHETKTAVLMNSRIPTHHDPEDKMGHTDRRGQEDSSVFPGDEFPLWL